MFDMVFGLMFLLVLGVFLFAIVRGVSAWNRNNNSPRLTVDAAVASKRMDVAHHQAPNAGDASGAHGFTTSTSTCYYVAFQVASGDRMEFEVNGREYGMLAEGDHGRLSFQGTRFLGFESDLVQ